MVWVLKDALTNEKIFGSDFIDFILEILTVASKRAFQLINCNIKKLEIFETV